MKRKYLIFGVIMGLLLVGGVSLAYIIPRIVAKKSSVSISIGELYIVFTDNQEIIDDNIGPDWTYTKTFTVDNQSGETQYYNIIISDLVNELNSNTLVYKLTSDNNGYNMQDFEPVPLSSEPQDTELATNIKIEKDITQEYTITFSYPNSETVDQSDDMGKTLSGRLNITSGEKTLANAILEQYESIYKGERKHFDQTVGDHDTDDGTTYDVSGLYKESGNFTEEGKDVYYFSGNITNNWVSFAGYLWRIIRTNEDGSLRLLYGGPEKDQGNSQEQYIGGTNVTRAYNGTYNNPMYVGFKYGDSGTLSSNRTNGTPAPILGTDADTNSTGNSVTLNGWYKANMNKSDGQTTYEWDKYISRTAVYCNDRAVPSGRYGTSSTFYYGAGLRLTTGSSSYGGVSQASNYHPSYKCGVDYQGNLIESSQAEADKFSGTNNSAKLTYPIGLITADEIAYAGGKYGTNSPKAYYYLTADGKNSATGNNYWWTMSPLDASSDGWAVVFSMHGSSSPGSLGNFRVDNTHAVRPVVSLKSCLRLTDASGTADDPYEVETISPSCAEALN